MGTRLHDVVLDGQHQPVVVDLAHVDHARVKDVKDG
jgi:hypothetical protein